MKKIILINIFVILFLTGCSPSTVEYLPAVVYLKSPEVINVNGENKVYIEFAVSDLNELEGNVDLTIADASGSKLFDKKLNKLLFSTDGTLVSFYADEFNTSDKLSFNFKVCNTDDLCREQLFKDIEINTESESDEVNIDGKLLSDNNLYEISVHLSSMAKDIIPDENGDFSINNINSGKYDLYTKGKELNDGFYRYIYLKSLNFNKSSKIYLYIPIDENQEYDEPLINCSYSSETNNNIFILIFVLLIFIIAGNKSKKAGKL